MSRQIHKAHGNSYPKRDRLLRFQKGCWWLRWLFPLTGLLALIWFLVRVVPKPSRATYPCQRVAAPLACSFITWLVGIVTSVLAYRKAKCLIRQSRYLMGGACAVVAVMAIWWSLGITGKGALADFTPPEGANNPIGIAQGIHPGRVVWVHEPNATSWDGSSYYWWDNTNTDQTVVDSMTSEAIQALTAEPNDSMSWDALFRHFNQQKGKGNNGYQAGEQIVIKINMNNSGSGNKIDAAPQMVRGLLRQLVYQAGVGQSAITVYDAQRDIGAPVYNCCHPEFPEVGYNANIGWVSDAITYSAEPIGSDARRLPQCVLDAEYMINMSILKRHDAYAAVTLCGKNHFGTIGSPSALHTYIRCWERGMGSYDPLVDIMGNENIGGKTILYIIDGLYGGHYWGATPMKWLSVPFSNDWPSSIFVSQDPVAIDSVGMDFLRAEWVLRDNADNYLHEAAQANSPPSGVFYDPEGDGSRLDSLGVHEHWNNATKKQYSRNLRTAEGVELVKAPIILGDINGGGVDFEDVAFIAEHWLEEGCNSGNGFCSGADLDRKGTVNFIDYALCAKDWGKGIAP